MAQITDYRAAILDIMRPSLGSRNYRVADIIKVLAPLQPHQLEGINEIVIERATSHDRLVVRLLHHEFPQLKIRTNFAASLDQVYQAMDEVVMRGRHEEGIFRLSKNAFLAENLASRILNEDRVELGRVIAYDLALLIKTFTKQAFPHLIRVADLETFRETGKVEGYLASLAPVRRQYVERLARMARDIAAAEATNRMSLSNLARVFAPNMFQDADPLIEFQLIGLTIQMVEEILRQG